MSKYQKGSSSSSSNPATGVNTPSVPIKISRSDGNKGVSRMPLAPQGGKKK